MPSEPRRARDLRLLDQVDAVPRRAHDGAAWRVTPDGRDPLQGGRSLSRWCNGEFDVLYTSLERDGAIAEAHALLSLQPVFPATVTFRVHRLRVALRQALHLVELPMLAELGVDTQRYRERDYRRTQEIADAAHFLGFDGLLVPSARWRCTNCVVFTERVAAESLALEETETEAVDWRAWRRQNRG